MHLTEQMEEILESMWIATNERGAESAKLSELPSVPDVHVLKGLIEARLVEQCGDEKFRFTDLGAHEGADAVRRHRLAERLLTDVLAVRRELIHESACEFEHHLHKGIDSSVCTLLGHPKTCPHGKPIPSGRCCEAEARQVERAIAKLGDLKPGQGGDVAYISATDSKSAQTLFSIGVLPGVKVQLLAGFPSFLMQFGESRFAVDRQVADSIYVRLNKLV